MSVGRCLAESYQGSVVWTGAETTSAAQVRAVTMAPSSFLT